jgi:hypothetical protein
MGTGTVLLAAARRLVRAAGDDPPPRAAVLAARALGLRDVAQGAALALRPDRRTLDVGNAVDGLHALSMLTLAVADRRHRRLALVAAAQAVAELLATRALTGPRASR